MKINNLIKSIYHKKLDISAALIHSSYANKNSKVSNEKLEFLGDSVINFVVTNWLYNSDEKKEGNLSKLRAKLVSTANLAKACDDLNLVDDLKIIGEVSTKIKANLFEAVVASIYLGLNRNIKEVEKFLKAAINLETKNLEDYKTKLQEILQQQKVFLIKYETKRQKGNIFLSVVSNNNITIAKGSGKTKKEAEQQAAKQAVKRIKEGK